MDAAALYNTIVTVVGGILLGVIAYFLKRTISLVDRCEKDIRELDAAKVSEKDFCNFKADTEKKFDKISAISNPSGRIISPRKTSSGSRLKPTASLT
jgi:hypothetical protein